MSSQTVNSVLLWTENSKASPNLHFKYFKKCVLSGWPSLKLPYNLGFFLPSYLFLTRVTPKEAPDEVWREAKIYWM